MAIEYTPKETSNLVNKISEGGAFQTSGGQELSTSKSFASKAVAASRDAATSEANSQSSETASAASASASAASALSSASSATAAGTSETSAATSATAAGTSETNAATSETNAATSTTNASTSENNASTSATNAATSETNAAASATSASTSETDAATSATNAAASYDSFDDRYLGPKASAPTLDNDGGALLTGALYFNSTSELMKIWSGSLWLDAFAPSGTVSWGIISGTLSDQTDLKAYIDTMLPLAGGDVTGPITTNSTFDGRDVSVDGAKIDGIEALADVTDTANVVAALTAGNGVNISAGGVVAVSSVALTTVQTAVSEITHLALSTQEGDVVVRSDLEQTFMHNGGVAGTIADFTLLTTPTDSVTSVDGLTGVVTLDHDSLAGFVANEHVDYTAGGTFGGNIDVTGTATMDGLVVDGEAVLGNGTDGLKSSWSTGNSTGIIDTAYTSTGIEVRTGNVQRMLIDSTGIDVTGTATMDGLTVSGATLLDVGNEGTLQVGPTTTVADENQTFEMRGSNGSNELQRFQITNRGETGTVSFKFGRAGATPTNVISIGPTGAVTMDGLVVDGSLSTPTAGTQNLRLGVNAGNSLVSGSSYNTLIGDGAGTAVTTGTLNTLVGGLTGDAVTEGAENVAMGVNALGTDTKGSFSTALGGNALQTQNFTSATNVYNTGVGFAAGKLITTGIKNTIIGALSGDALTDADFNTVLGYNTLSSDTLGSQSVAIGSGALHTQNFTSATNTYNTAVGSDAGNRVTTGIKNTIIGALSGDALTTGDGNTLVGYDSGSYTTSLTTGANNTLVGILNHTSAADSDYAFGFGYNLNCAADYTTIGKGGSDIRAQHGVATWATVSDERYKKDITDATAGLSFINALRPRTWNYKTLGELPETFNAYEADSTEVFKNTQTNHGFIAQEVKTAIDADSGLKDGFRLWDDRPDGSQEVAESALIPVLVKAIQEQSALIEALTARIVTLEG